ncbi:MAG: NAD(P)(+) transhydrogenase (Re/Si-specific) subunit beta [Gaiellaceae bacterium]
MSTNLANLLYLIPIASFILALRFLSNPAHARRGNQIGAIGMLVAIVVTWIKTGTTSWWAIAVGMLIGGGFGAVAARRVKMTAMPQMVALFNGVGGGAAALIALAEVHRILPAPGSPKLDISVAIALSGLIGAISFSGSMVAFAKLQELIKGRPITYPGQKFVNLALLAACLALAVTLDSGVQDEWLLWAVVGGGALFGVGLAAGIALVAGVQDEWLLWVLIGAALLFGVLFVLPIGGADMPVVISLLNAFTGVAVAISGFELENNVMIVAGALVGASGTLLTMMMGRAMNRSIGNVLFGAFGQVSEAAATAAATDGGTVRSASAEDVAVMLAYAHKVVFVPGYGLAVAQAQHDVRQLADLLEAKGVEVSYAIHPVAGRMPGHMNVLLAEANVPYPQLKEMDEINPEFARTDVAVVVGANDVVNPDARNNQGSPIYGMPILNVDQANAVVVLKRSMNPGFAGVENPLFYNPKTVMLFGDAKDSIDKLIADVKGL